MSTHYALGWVVPRIGVEVLEGKETPYQCRKLNPGFMVVTAKVVTD